MKRFLASFGVTETRNIISVMVVAGGILYLFMLALTSVPAANKDIVNILGGSFLSGYLMVLSFYFGASKKDVSSETTTTK